MSFFKRLFGSIPEKQTGEELKNGDFVTCGTCNKKLKVKYFPKGHVFVGGQELMDYLRGLALACQYCKFIVCIDCAMKPLQGQAPSCPHCNEIMGPTVFTEGFPINKP